MNIPPVPQNEQERLEALLTYQILDTETEKDFDDIVQLASQICEVPISLISLIDEGRQWFKAKVGLGVRETPRKYAFCAYTILDKAPLVVENATEDERFVQNPLVTQAPSIRFYAGIPLINPQGYALGTLCVIDQKPHQLSPQQFFALQTLANQVVHLLEGRLKNNLLEAKINKIETQKLQLKKITENQSKIISILSHDIRSPLNSLKSAIELTQSIELQREDLLKILTESDKNINSVLELLDNILSWGSKQSCQEIQFTTFNLYELVQETIALQKLAAEQKNNIILNLLSENEKLTADENMISFIIRNLVTNAIKFTKNGTISIYLKKEDKFIQIFVQDTGVGISPIVKQKLFDWSKKISLRGTSNEKGSGLGLLIAQEFVLKHQGSIEIKSKEGEGTTFIIKLPHLQEDYFCCCEEKNEKEIKLN